MSAPSKLHRKECLVTTKLDQRYEGRGETTTRQRAAAPVNAAACNIIRRIVAVAVEWLADCMRRQRVPMCTAIRDTMPPHTVVLYICCSILLLPYSAQ
ncbi:unnamed protein product, partial [Toxocara canis]|uniref:Uncharacterized protein n=1 Tax=Toxocara canis TaxID=6265 RepID=A0A183V8B6_TOXCA